MRGRRRVGGRDGAHEPHLAREARSGGRPSAPAAARSRKFSAGKRGSRRAPPARPAIRASARLAEPSAGCVACAPARPWTLMRAARRSPRDCGGAHRGRARARGHGLAAASGAISATVFSQPARAPGPSASCISTMRAGRRSRGRSAARASLCGGSPRQSWVSIDQRTSRSPRRSATATVAAVQTPHGVRHSRGRDADAGERPAPARCRARALSR